MVAQQQPQRTFVKFSDEDLDWLDSQPASVVKLWHHAAKSDRWGDGTWRELVTTLTGSTFKTARRKLQQSGVFQFRPMRGEYTGDARTIDGWEVINLHGSSSDYYKEIAVKNLTDISNPHISPKIEGKNSSAIDKNSSAIDKNSSAIDKNSSAIKPETLTSLENSATLDLIRSNKTYSDFAAPPLENRSGHSVGSAPLRGAPSDAPGASIEESTESGATHESKDLGRSEPCRTSSESGSGISHTEANSTSKTKSSAAPRPISLQSDVHLFEDKLQGASNQVKVQSDSEMLISAIEALPATHKRTVGGFCHWLAITQDRKDYAKQLLPLMDILGRTDLEVLKAAILEMKPRVERNERIGSFGMHLSLAIANNSKQ